MISSLNKITPTQHKDTKSATHLKAVEGVNSVITDVIRDVENPIDPNLGSIKQKLIQHKVDLSKKIEQPPVILQVLCNGIGLVFATLGNFSLIIGKAKSRKTYFVSLLISAFLFGNTFLKKFKSTLPKGKTRIIVIDTEQSPFHVQRVVERILTTSGLTSIPDHIDFYCLRSFSTEERREAIEYLIYNTPDLGLVVIDGIRDLVFDINDGKEATRMADDLLRWTGENNIHVITVLHQNKSDNNARGHLGAELTNKAESVLSVAKDSKNKNNSIATPEFFRDKEFEPFAFSVNEQNIPYLLDDYICPQQNEEGCRNPRKGIAANEIGDSTHFEVLREVFINLDNPTRKTVMDALAMTFRKRSVELADKRQGQFMAYYNQKGWLKTEKIAGRQYPVYRLNLPM